MPVFRLAGVIFRMRGIPVGKLDLILVEAESFHHRQGEIDAGFHFAFDLRGHAENVRVVLGEAAHAQQAVQHAGALVAIDGAELGEAHGQLAITAQFRFVNENVARAIHRLELVVGLLDFDRAEHILAVKIGVAAGLPQIEQHDVRRVDQLVAAPQQFVAQPVFHELADQAALGMPEDQARAGLVLNAEEIELGAEFAVIAALGFFEAMQIFVEFLLREKAARRKCAGAADCLPGLSSRRRRRSST